jgi:hypothetical protein
LGGADALPIQSAAVGPAGTFFSFGPFTHAATAAPSPYVRVRLSRDTAGVSSPTSTGEFGEVEDYVLPGTGGPNSQGLFTPGNPGADAGDAPLPYPPVAALSTECERLGLIVDADVMSPVGFPTSGTAAWDDDGPDDDGIARIDGL